MADHRQDDPRTTRAHVTRRAVVGAAAWSPPAIVLATAAPSHATSHGGNSVDIAVAVTSKSASKVVHTVTLTNNTAGTMDPMRLQWTFYRTGPAWNSVTRTSGTFFVESDPFVEGADFSSIWLKTAPLPTGTTFHSFEWEIPPSNYTADVTVTALPGTGTGGTAATTY
ncbi:hypothetical protein [Nocardioides sp.]|uniref:hypothetical protein n=1 Tax=Nocardioides sp. TaxID=35761 RepID=UPI002B2671DB|nr:hypothetical protein [Nocardioides sp.]